jgi:hypothetical protein
MTTKFRLARVTLTHVYFIKHILCTRPSKSRDGPDQAANETGQRIERNKTNPGRGIHCGRRTRIENRIRLATARAQRVKSEHSSMQKMRLGQSANREPNRRARHSGPKTRAGIGSGDFTVGRETEARSQRIEICHRARRPWRWNDNIEWETDGSSRKATNSAPKRAGRNRVRCGNQSAATAPDPERRETSGNERVRNRETLKPIRWCGNKSGRWQKQFLGTGNELTRREKLGGSGPRTTGNEKIQEDRPGGDLRTGKPRTWVAETKTKNCDSDLAPPQKGSEQHRYNVKNLFFIKIKQDSYNHDTSLI